MALLYTNVSSITKSVVLRNSKSEQYESYIGLTVDILKLQNPKKLKPLKDFLTFLPSPVHIEQVLIAAVIQLAEVDVSSCRWILQNPEYLMPELDLIEVVKNSVIVELESKGSILGQDFQLTDKGQLLITNNIVSEYLEGLTDVVNFKHFFSAKQECVGVEIVVNKSFLCLIKEEILQI